MGKNYDEKFYIIFLIKIKYNLLLFLISLICCVISHRSDFPVSYQFIQAELQEHVSRTEIQ